MAEGYIFISYAANDGALAQSVCVGLERRGIRCWIAPRDVQGGSSWPVAISKALAESSGALFVISKEALRSHHLLREATEAGKLGKRLVTLYLAPMDPSDLPHDFRPVLATHPAVTWDPSVEPFDRLLPLLQDGHGRAQRTVRETTIAELVEAPGIDERNLGAAVPTPDESSVAQSPSSQRALLFICYRREDTQAEAGRLYDKLTDTFGPNRVFMDIDSVPFGVDFVDYVREQVGKCSATVVMIGRKWLTVTDRKGRRRLDQEDDLVRTEVAAALRSKIPVIPVLVQGAEMPLREDLPEDIAQLARRHGIELTHSGWRAGVDRLIDELKPALRR